MSSDVELLPLPEPLLVRADIGGLYTGRECQHYTRANMEPLIAENERLRAEVELWRHKAAVHQYRRNRLAEALRDARARTANLAAWLKSGNDVPVDLPFVFRERWQKIAADIRALEAALAQEGRA